MDVNVRLSGRRYVGVTEGRLRPQFLLPAFVELVRHGRMPSAKLIRRYPLEQINGAATAIAAGEVVKPDLTFPATAP